MFVCMNVILITEFIIYLQIELGQTKDPNAVSLLAVVINNNL